MPTELNGFNTRGALAAACAAGTLGVMIFAILPFFLGLLGDSLQLNDQQLGFLASAYVGGYTLICVLSFLWITRLHWQHVFAGGIVLMVTGLLVSHVQGDYNGVMAGLIISGLGAGFMHSLSAAMVSEMIDADRKFGIKMIPEQGVSALLLFLMPVLIIARWGLPGLLGTLAVVFLMAFFFLSRVPPQGLKQQQEQRITATVKPIYVFVALFGLLAYFGGIAGVWAFMERFASEGGLDRDKASQLLALGVVTSAIGPVIPAIVGNRFGRSTPLILSTLVLIGCLFLFAGSMSLMRFGVILFFLPMAWYAGMAYQMGVIADADDSGRFSVLMTAALGIGATIGPGLLGVIKTSQNLQAALFAAAVIATVGAVASIWVARSIGKENG